MKNKIFVNSRFLTQKITGAQRFAIEISRQLKRLEPERFIFVAPKNIIHINLAKELRAEVIGVNTGHIWEQIDLPLYLKNRRVFLLLNLLNTAPLFYKNKIITIMDLSWKHFPKAVSKKFYFWYKFLIPKIAKESKHIFTISQFSKNDISNELNIKENIITNISCAFSEDFKNIGVKRGRQILSVASLQPYKNIDGIIQAFISLKEKGRFAEYKLILVGGYNENVFRKIKIFNVIKSRSDIVLTGYIDDEKLIELYNKSSLFVLTSLFEGFGLPPLEAMACGCPVVVSNVASLPEVCGDAAYYVNPYDINDIANGIDKVLTDENLRRDLIEKGFENVKRFSWEKSAKQMIKVFNEVLNK